MAKLNFDTKNKTKHQLIEARDYSDNKTQFEPTESFDGLQPSKNIEYTLGSLVCIMIIFFVLWVLLTIISIIFF